MPQTPLGDLTALFRSRRFSGGLLLRRGKRREGRNKEKRGLSIAIYMALYGITVITHPIQLNTPRLNPSHRPVLDLPPGGMVG